MFVCSRNEGRERVAERDPIDLIKEQLSRVDDLAGLHSDHEVFRHWCGETKSILEKIFNPKSIHVQNFVALRFREMSVKAFASPEIDKINAARYKRDLDHARNILQGAIKELALDRTLFKKIQTTPKTVEVSLEGEYFLSSSILDPEMIRAIRQVFEGTGLNPTFAKESGQTDKSLSHRIDQIKRARFGIYALPDSETTDTLLELGAALGLGKEVTLICRTGSSVPEAIRSVGAIEYEDFSDLIKKLRKKLA